MDSANGNTTNHAVRKEGLFIVLEGGDGSGKTTQAQILADTLYAMGINVHLTREPGDTPLGQGLRALLLDRERETTSKVAQALLFAADRAEHVETVIMPALKRGEVVICDRFSASTMAYQSYAGGLPYNKVREMSNWASGGLVPNVTFFLDVPPELGLVRAKRVEHTSFEDKSLEYHHRVREGFHLLRDASFASRSWLTVDANRTIPEVQKDILARTLIACRIYGHLPSNGK